MDKPPALLLKGIVSLFMIAFNIFFLIKTKTDNLTSKLLLMITVCHLLKLMSITTSTTVTMKTAGKTQILPASQLQHNEVVVLLPTIIKVSV